MPWCPKCKTEYREGFRVCADCGSELVEREPKDTGELNSAEEARFVEYTASMEKEGGRQDGAARPAGTDGGGLYQDSSERASENRSSAWVLLCLGVLGVIAVALGAAGILPLHFGDPYLFYGVMGAIFILFVVAGIVSMKNATIFEKKAESENSLRQTLLDWCRENLDAQDIDVAVGAAATPEEIAYFKRTSYIKEKLNHQFVNLNQGFLEQFIDDYIYDDIFGEGVE